MFGDCLGSITNLKKKVVASTPEVNKWQQYVFGDVELSVFLRNVLFLIIRLLSTISQILGY